MSSVRTLKYRYFCVIAFSIRARYQHLLMWCPMHNLAGGSTFTVELHCSCKLYLHSFT